MRRNTIHSIFQSITRTLFYAKCAQAGLCDDYDIGPQQLWILHILAAQDTLLTVKGLAERLHVTSGAITQLVDPLVTNGYIERQNSPNDRRVIHLVLTDKAHELTSSLFQAIIEPMFSTLSNEELTQLHQLLTKVTIPSNTLDYPHSPS